MKTTGSMGTRRDGYTLFELVLVMFLIVVAATLAVPFIEPMLAPNRIQSASDLVRKEWAEMRSRAMGEGRAYRFSVQENTGMYRIEPDEPPVAGEEDKGLTVECELEEHVVFVKSPQALIGLTTPPEGNGNWGTVVVFLPNGTAREDAVIYFGLVGMQAQGLRIRGLTGAVAPLETPQEEALP